MPRFVSAPGWIFTVEHGGTVNAWSVDDEDNHDGNPRGEGGRPEELESGDCRVRFRTGHARALKAAISLLRPPHSSRRGRRRRDSYSDDSGWSSGAVLVVGSADGAASAWNCYGEELAVRQKRAGCLRGLCL